MVGPLGFQGRDTAAHYRLFTPSLLDKRSKLPYKE
jgi:hypothetical protein